MGCTVATKVGPDPQQRVEERINGVSIVRNNSLPAKIIVTKDQREADKEPIKIYSTNRTFVRNLEMTGELLGYIEYQPDNELEVETAMRDYIDLLMNPHSTIKPRERKLKY